MKKYLVVYFIYSIYEHTEIVTAESKEAVIEWFNRTFILDRVSLHTITEM